MRRLTPLLFLLAACSGRQPPVPDGYVDSAEDPITPTGSWTGPTFAELLEVETWGTRLAFCSGVQGLQLWEAGDPTQMTLLDEIGVDLGSASYPRCQRLTVDDAEGVIWVTNHGDQIHPTPFLAAIDAGNPEELTQTTALTRNESLEGLDHDADHLYVAAHGDGLMVFTKTATAVPQLVGTLPLGNAWNVRVDGSIAYVANGQFGIAVVDIADPNNPMLLAELEVGGVSKDVDLDGDRLYVATGSGVAVIDVSSPSAPALVETHSTPGSALDLAHDPSTNGLYVADWTRIRVFSTADPDALELVGTEPLVDADSRTLGIAGRDGLIFSSNWTQMAAYTYHPDRRAPDLRISPSTLAFGNAAAGEEAFASISLTNDGSEPLDIVGLVLPDDMALTELPDRLEPGRTASATLTWTAPDAQAWDGEVSVQSNDVDQPVQSVGAEANQPGLGVGDTAPAFGFTDLQGTQFTVADAGGEVTLLAYFATF